MPLPPLNIFEKLRGLYTPVTDLRRRVLTEVARMAVEDKPASFIEEIPYIIIKGPEPTYRVDIFLERAIVRERVRLCFGMDLKEFGAHGPIHDDDVAKTLTAKKVLRRPIVNVIKIACERCPTKSYFVSDLCRGCIAHPCTSVCPKKAVSIIDGKSVINQDLCIKCGKCAQVCPYNAIAYRERPCAAACGVNAIGSDDDGYAIIDYEKCVTCGLCIVSCPFAAIAEKSEIVQIIYALKSNRPVYAEIAPSFVSQFGPLVSPEKIIASIIQLGFRGVKEVAFGADVDTLGESKHLIKLLRKEDKKDSDRLFVGTSCCPSWVKAAQLNYPELSKNISPSFTPMVETAKKIKREEPDAVVVFIGPCIAKKMECFQENVAAFVDFVMTFEELAALFQSMDVDPAELELEESIQDASTLGRGFPVAGGVAKAIIEQTRSIHGDVEIPFEAADTLEECLTMLRKIKNKKFDPMPVLVEGMACPYGCIGGPGTLAPLRRAKREVAKFSKRATWRQPNQYLPSEKKEGE